MLRQKNKERLQRVIENKQNLQMTAERDLKNYEKRKLKFEKEKMKNRKMNEKERQADHDEKMAKYDEKMQRQKDLQADQIRKSMRAFKQ